MLLEEGKTAGKAPTVKKVATPSADVMKAKGLLPHGGWRAGADNSYFMSSVEQTVRARIR